MMRHKHVRLEPVDGLVQRVQIRVVPRILRPCLGRGVFIFPTVHNKTKFEEGLQCQIL